MRAVVQWAVRNSPAMNTLMVAVIVSGAACMIQLQRERFPESAPNIVEISVAYPGASPGETEQAICLRIEEAIRSVAGVRKMTTWARESSGLVQAELNRNVDSPQEVLHEIRSAVDQIASRFPKSAERPKVRLNIRFRNVISVAILGPELSSDTNTKRERVSPDAHRDSTPNDDPNLPAHSPAKSPSQKRSELQLRYLFEQVRDELLLLPAVTHVNSWQAKPYQIDVEIPTATLRRHGLTHADVTEAIRKSNIEIPAGELKTAQTNYLLRISDRGMTGDEIARIPVVQRADGVVLTVGDLGSVNDGLADIDIFARINGRLAMSHEIVRTPDQDMFAIYEQVHEWAANKQLPAGYELLIWNDYSRQARKRLDLLTDNAIIGLMLVFLMLALFLNGRLAFWVAFGIPFAFFGTCGVMLLCGATLNLYSMFAFVMALGIVVDDAIVVSENVFRHRQLGKSAWQAAIDGTSEVATSVVSSVLTTVIAFLPLAYVSGDLGQKIGVIPLVVISMLLISLVEGLLILPCHLSHAPQIADGPPARRFWLVRILPALQGKVTHFLQWTVDRVYLPTLRWTLGHPAISLCSSVTVICITVGLYQGGFTKFVLEKKLDYAFVYTYIDYPDGTPTEVVDAATQRLVEALHRVDPGQGRKGESLFRMIYRGVGFTGLLKNTRGEVYVEFDPAKAFREEYPTSQQIVARWRDEVREEFPGAQRVVFWGLNNARGGRPIELSLLASDVGQLERIAVAIKKQLATYAGVKDITDSRGPGRWELQLKMKPDAQALGIQLADVAQTVRAAYQGDEAMRLQRGRQEVKLMIRNPPEERFGLDSLNQLYVPAKSREFRTSIPLSELVDMKIERGYSTINRIDQQRAVTIRADVDEEQANAREIVADLREQFLPDVLAKNPGVYIRWEGQQEQTRESVGSLLIGFMVAIFGMFGLLTLEFRSYVQPLIILIVIPFGFTGAVWAHCLLAEPITLLSLFGMVTLSGILANDSIVLVDFINREIAAGVDIDEALLTSGRSRFRPVVLTSVTTIVALLPLLFGRTSQAQNLIPMAVSVAGGLCLATIWVLLFVPLLFRITFKLAAKQTKNQLASEPSVSNQLDEV